MYLQKEQDKSSTADEFDGMPALLDEEESDYYGMPALLDEEESDYYGMPALLDEEDDAASGSVEDEDPDVQDLIMEELERQNLIQNMTPEQTTSLNNNAFFVGGQVDDVHGWIEHEMQLIPWSVIPYINLNIFTLDQLFCLTSSQVQAITYRQIRQLNASQINQLFPKMNLIQRRYIDSLARNT